jgi:hypothetical protein
MRSLLIISLFLTACGSETDKALSEKIKEYETQENAEEIEGSESDTNEESAAEKSDVRISRPDDSSQLQPVACGDFAVKGDFKASVTPDSGVTLSVKMNEECDFANFHYDGKQLEVTMCSNSTDWLLAQKTVKTRVTELSIVRSKGVLSFLYRTNGKTETLEYISIKGEFENDASICFEQY